MKIVFANFDKLDFRNTIEKISVIKSVEQLGNSANKDTTYLLAVMDEQSKAVGDSGHQVYVPSTGLTTDNKSVGWHVYFDLENYPFYQKVKAMIGKEDKPKGVLRFRRMVKKDENPSLLAGDLYVLSSLLGEPQGIHVKQTDQSVLPAHTIVLMDFGGGTMAHIEYTVTKQERIELEWSGIKTILEFDSDQMRPIEQGSKASLPLAYTVDAIIESARKVDQQLVNELSYFGNLINGGTHT